MATAIDIRIEIQRANESYYEAISQLCDERYGEGYLTREIFDHWIACPQLFWVALVDGDFAGFAVMVPATLAYVMEQMGMPQEDIKASAAGKPMLIYKSAAVMQKYERRGIMTAMATDGLEAAQEMGYGVIFASAWIHDGIVPIQGTFDKFGFTPLYDRKMLWYNMEDYYCIICKGRCVCDARIYQKKL